MSKKIFGHDWEDIQAAQRGERPLHKAVDMAGSGKNPATDEDYAMLEQYGSIMALKNAGLHGVVDRLHNSEPESETICSQDNQQ